MAQFQNADSVSKSAIVIAAMQLKWPLADIALSNVRFRGRTQPVTATPLVVYQHRNFVINDAKRLLQHNPPKSGHWDTAARCPLCAKGEGATALYALIVVG